MTANNATVVLAHGAWADGSSWAKVITMLAAGTGSGRPRQLRYAG
jgi:hypothetical protein